MVLSPDYINRNMLIQSVSMLEDAGYESVFVPEIWGRDAFTFLTQLAQTTSKIKLGTGIVNLYSRSPATLAMTAASLAEISNGRFILGLGLSGPIVVEQLHGIPYTKPLARTKETVAIIRTLLNGERLNHSGEVFNVQRFKLSFKPEQYIPIFLASLGPKNIQLTGEIADGWFPLWITHESFPIMYKSLLSGLEKVQKKREDFTIAPFMITVASEKENVRDLARGHLAYYVGGMGTFYYELMVRHGYQTIADQIRTAWNNNDRKAAANAISDEMLDMVTLAGTPDDVKERLKSWYSLGIDLPLIFLPYKTSPEVAFETLQTLAPNL